MNLSGDNQLRGCAQVVSWHLSMISYDTSYTACSAKSVRKLEMIKDYGDDEADQHATDQNK